MGGVLFLGILSRLMGLVREMLVAGTFGTGEQLDAVLLGMALPVSLCLGLGGGIGRAMVPAGARLERAYLGGFFRQALRRFLMMVLPLTVILILSAPMWARLMVPEGSPIPVGAVVIAGAIGCLALLGTTFAGVCKGVSNAHARHVTAAVSPLFHNLFVIGSVLLLARDLGAYSLLIGVVLAEWGQVIPMYPFLRRVTARVKLPRAEIMASVQAILPPAIFLAMAAGLMGTVDRFFAASLEEGSVSALAYADRLMNLPVMLMGLALQAPLFTRLSRFAAEKDHRRFDFTLELGLRSLLLAGGPMVIVFAGLPEPVIRLLLERGAFTAADTAVTGVALRGYAVAILFQSMVPLLASASLALGSPWRIAGIYAVMIVLNAILDALLVEQYGLLGITMATSVVSALTVLAMTATVAPRVLTSASVWASLLFTLASAAAGVVAAVLYMALAPRAEGGLLSSMLYLSGGLIVVGGITAALFGFRYLKEFRRLKALAGRAGG